MSSCTIYHNNRCSKSRDSLALLRDSGIEPTVVNYLDSPPDRESLEDLIVRMGLRPRDVIRRKEKLFKELNLNEFLNDDDKLLDAMLDNPILIERPIVVVGNKVTIGRPPERILEIL